jgi:hypothetical protein
MNHKEQLSKIKAIFGLQVALESMKLDNGVEIEAESFESGKDVFIVQDGEKIAMPIGEYGLEDGKVLVIAEEGVISEVKEAAAEEAPAEEELAETPELAAEEAAPQPKKMVESISKELFFSTIDELKAEIAELKLSKVEVKEEVIEDVKEEVELSTEKVVHNPEAKSEKQQIKFSQKRPLSTKDIVFNKLFKN